MTPHKKSDLLHDILTVIILLAVLLIIVRLWPLLLLLLTGLIAYALWILFQTARQPAKAEPAPLPMLPAPVSEQAVLTAAFSLLQRRITEQAVTQHPNVRWVWGVPDAFARFSTGQDLTILLNGAGGYRVAAVQVQDLQFAGLIYIAAANIHPDPEAPDITTPQQAAPHAERETVDYGLLAFEWVEANLPRLQALNRETAGAGQDEFRIPAEELPHGDSWLALCAELARNGFAGARPVADGVHIKIKSDGSVIKR